MPNGTSSQTSSFFHTYRALASAEAEIEQGDILAKTPEVLEIIKEVHPHYLKSDYTHFLVLTQSCDLVRRRSSGCKSRYISLAAIRPLGLVVSREIEKYQDTFDRAAMVCSTQYRFQVKQFLERLFNYNEHEYFYLHPEARGNLPEPSCAFLRLSVALKSDHYEVCQRARILSLAPLYQAKLGWMVGNMYSRVGTDDWVPTAEPQGDFEKRVKVLLDKYCNWVEPRKLNGAKKSQPPGLLTEGQESILRHIEQTEAVDLLDEVITAVLAQLGKLEIGQDEVQAKKIRARLANDGVLAKLRRLQVSEE